MVAARRGDHAHGGDHAGQEMVERAARLERARVLEEFQLEDEANRGQAEVRAVDFEHRRTANVGSEASRGGADGGGVEGGGIHGERHYA